MAESGLIKCVTRPTPWCSPFLVVLKPKGGVRPVVDYKGLNQFVVRPVHPFLAAPAAVESIPKSSRYFATLDGVLARCISRFVSRTRRVCSPPS